MGHERGILSDICANPGDDLPRLVYADWCDDHGDDARAGFIRAQVELSRMGRFDPRRSELAWREAVLLAAHGAAWGKAAKAFADEFEFERGFVEHFALSAFSYFKRADDLHRAFPVRTLELTSLPQGFRAADLSPLGRLEGLALPEKFGAAGLGRIVGDPVLETLRDLSIVGSRLSRPDLLALEGAFPLRGLASLEVRDCQAGPALATRLMRSPLAGLRRLELAGNALAAGAGDLADWPPAWRLRHLGLADNRIDPAILGEIAARPWPELETLDLDGAILGPDDEGMDALAREGAFPRLRSLKLGGSRRHFRHPARFFAVPAFRGLEELGLEGQVILESADLAPIADSPMLPGLRAFKTPACSGYILNELLAAPALAGLAELGCVGNDLGPATTRAVADATHLTNLRLLDLSHCALTDLAIGPLADSAHLSNLNELKLAHNRLGESGLLRLAASPHLKRLTLLRLVGNDVSPTALAALTERFGPGVVRC